MFIRLLYGESAMMLLNPNCCAKIFVDYIKEKCEFDQEALIDLCDENGALASIHSKSPSDNVCSLLTPRVTYIPVLIERLPDETIKSILPLLVNWDRIYPSLEKKLKQHTVIAEKPKKSANEGKGKRNREKEKMDRLGADPTTARRSSMGTSSNEVSSKPSQMKQGRKK